jgi:hypothetical protein
MRAEAKRPDQPKPGQGQAAGFAGRAEGASLDQAPVVRQRLPGAHGWDCPNSANQFAKLRMVPIGTLSLQAVLL